MYALLAILSISTAQPAQARVVHTCACSMYVVGEPGFLFRGNWLFAESEKKSVATAAARSACVNRYGQNPPSVYCIASKDVAPLASRRRQLRNPSRTNPEEAERLSREAHDYIEEIRRKNRKDQIRDVLIDARRRGVRLPGDYK